MNLLSVRFLDRGQRNTLPAAGIRAVSANDFRRARLDNERGQGPDRRRSLTAHFKDSLLGNAFGFIPKVDS